MRTRSVWYTKATQMLANHRAKAISGTRAFTTPSLYSHTQFSQPFLPLAFFRLCSFFLICPLMMSWKVLTYPLFERVIHYRARIAGGEIFRENHIMKSLKMRTTEGHVGSHIAPVGTSLTLVCYGNFKNTDYLNTEIHINSKSLDLLCVFGYIISCTPWKNHN